jgi:hypothetical protein
MKIKIIMCVNGLLMISAFLLCTNTFASTALQARIQIGLNLLPSVISSNTIFTLDGDDKTHPVTIYVIYNVNDNIASEASAKLSRIKNIRGHQLIIKSISIKQVSKIETDSYTALIIIEPMRESLDQLISFSIQRQLLFFSPFKGDVKKGVMAGYEVTNKVLPAVNLTALNEAKIRLKAFFLRIAVTHD